VIVKVRGILLRFTDYETDIQVGCETVRDGLVKLIDRYPKLRDALMDREGSVRGAHFIALNGEQLTVGELDREVNDDDRVDIITAISGG
jgi:molybdopterin synthase sulfur carrier subunit